MAIYGIDWSKKHIVKISNDIDCNDEVEKKDWRKKIEPWLTAVFQSEHFSLLVGNGLTTAVTKLADSDSQGMSRINFNEFKKNAGGRVYTLHRAYKQTDVAGA